MNSNNINNSPLGKVGDEAESIRRKEEGFSLKIKHILKLMKKKDIYFMAYQLNSYGLTEEYKQLIEFIKEEYPDVQQLMLRECQQAEIIAKEFSQTLYKQVWFDELDVHTMLFVAVMPVKAFDYIHKRMQRSDEYTSEQLQLMTKIKDRYLQLNKITA